MFELPEAGVPGKGPALAAGVGRTPSRAQSASLMSRAEVQNQWAFIIFTTRRAARSRRQPEAASI
ncbi:hypothetical protein [Streptomyces griseochromogenes]|uniref:hypothetical protein n=1 Tax=Streptomyces griseochromogenes TaxID=68214 RepID=UPI0037ABA0BD